MRRRRCEFSKLVFFFFFFFFFLCFRIFFSFARFVVFWLILMRIRFRASDFGQVAKNNCHSCKIETGFLRGDGARVIYFFAHVIQQLGFRTKKIQANVDYCDVRRRAECTSLGPGLKRPSLRSLTLVWPRRDVPRRFT